MKNYIVTFKDQGSERSLGIPPEQILNAVASMAEGGEAQTSRVLHCPNLGLGFVRMQPKQAIALRENKQVLAVEEDLVVLPRTTQTTSCTITTVRAPQTASTWGPTSQRVQAHRRGSISRCTPHDPVGFTTGSLIEQTARWQAAS